MGMINSQARAPILGFDKDVIRCGVGGDASNLIAEGLGSFDVNWLIQCVDTEGQEHWLNNFFQPHGGWLFVGKPVCDLGFDIAPDVRRDYCYICWLTGEPRQSANPERRFQ